MYMHSYWAVERSRFPWLWFPAVERHYFKQRTYLSFPWVHLRFPCTLLSFYSTFRVCGIGEPWHANKTSLLSLIGTFRAVFPHQFVFISMTAAALHKWFVGSFLMSLFLCTLSQSLPFLGLRSPFKCSDHVPALKAEIRKWQQNLRTAHTPLHGPETAVVRRAESPYRSDYKSTWRKALCFPTPFVHTGQQ